MFQLHDRLAADTVPVAELGLCRALLMDNRVWPWLILVPARPDLTEIHQLEGGDRHRLVDEISLVSQVLEGLFRPDKINVGALGNMVPQLQVHVMARTKGDRAWPGQVWGSGFAERYERAERDAVVARVHDALREK